MLAWGDQGHHLTCQFAYGSLTPRARPEIDRLLATQAPRYRQFARACTYPDKVSDIDGHRALLFVNLRREDVDLPDPVCPIATASAARLLGTIEDNYAVLRTGQSSDSERAKALMCLGHWIGDLHQPLHVSFKDDIGGNSIQTTGLCTYRGNHRNCIRSGTRASSFNASSRKRLGATWSMIRASTARATICGNWPPSARPLGAPWN